MFTVRERSAPRGPSLRECSQTRIPPPDCFARYIAASALSTSVAASAAGRGNVAMPIDSPRRSRAPTSSGGSAAVSAFSMIRRATRVAASVSASGRITANSSPP